MHPRLIAPFALLTLGLTASACSGDDDDTSSGRDAGRDAALADDAGGTDLDAGTDPDGGGVSGTCDEPTPPFSDDEQTLVDLPPDSWWQAAGTPLRAVCPDGASGCGAVVTAWSGGAFDAFGNRMLVWGGGHADYSGNELYAFSLATLTWRRLTEPSPSEYASQDPLPDGQPVSRHSYDGLQFLEDGNVLVAHGGSRWQDGSGTGVTWTFDGATGTWRDMQPEGAPSLSNCCSEASAVDVSGRAVVYHLTGRLARYDLDANRWEELADFGFPPYWPRYEAWGDKRGTTDTRRGLLWFFGSGLYMVWDPAAGEAVTDDWVTTGGAVFTNADDVGGHAEQIITTGGGELIEAAAPGLDYDPAADAIVAWVGGGAWSLDLAGKAWTQGSGAGAPGAPVDHGTFGRFRYVRRTNVFVLVNGVDDDVWFYKHTAGCGP